MCAFARNFCDALSALNKSLWCNLLIMISKSYAKEAASHNANNTVLLD